MRYIIEEKNLGDTFNVAFDRALLITFPALVAIGVIIDFVALLLQNARNSQLPSTEAHRDGAGVSHPSSP